MADVPDPSPGMPRWVKVLGLLAGVLVLVVVALHVAGSIPGGHGP